ncbi:MAG TPA: Smr/MutS family protein [Gemmatimonadales bacterium]|nr:Smr/MutS family protein [Gemmatimonadales bacterium]
MTALDSTAVQDGVSAQRSAGTPSPLGPEASSAALAVLEFERVLELVAQHAAGPLAAYRVRARRPLADFEWIREELAPIGELLGLLADGGDVDVTPVPPLATVLSRLRLEGSVLEGAELLAIQRTLGAARSAAAELRRIAPAAPRVALLLVPVPEAALEKRIGQVVDENGEVLDSASPALLRARREIQASRERLVKKLETVLRGIDAKAADTGATVTMRNGRYVIPVRRDSRARPEGIVHDESASAGTLFVEPTAAIELGNALRAAIVEAEREVLRVLRELTERLRPHADELEQAHEMCVALDELLARARYARGTAGVVPEVLPPGGGLVLRQARHPLLLGRGIDVVPFDLELAEAERTLVISGPNAGGKTVLLKSVGLAAALVQSGIVPPLGAGSALPVFERFVADIGDHQSIAADLSTFSAHVAVLRGTLEAADSATLVLIDEIGSGTDPAEGAALAGAALRALTAQAARTIATTHLGALKALATQTPGIVNGSLQFDAERLEPTFRFRKGTPGRSYGLAIARRLGLAPAVLADAESRLSAAERSLDALLEAAEQREQRLAADQAVLSDRLAEAERQNARLARDAELARVRDAELRAREKDAERRARQEARRFLLEARERVEDALRAATAATTEREATEARRRLEAAIQLEGQALRELDEPEPAAFAAEGTVTEGQRVRLATGGTGKVLELRDDGKAVVVAGNVRMVVPAESLVPSEGGRESGDQGISRPSSLPPASRISGSPAPSEIDLRGMRVDEAESATIAAVDAAVLADLPFLRIIHGMGTGAVRDTVRRILGADRRVTKFDFAPRNQGGTGVTIAELGS